MKVAEAKLPTRFGGFKIVIYKCADGLEHSVLVKGEVFKEPVLVRIHSQCLTGDTFGSLKCDCGEQLRKSMKLINKSGNGLIIYLNQEGRGIGLTNKIKAYALQELGFDTVEANQQLGLPIDSRSYKIAAEILGYLGINEINLLTNNPDKQSQLSEYGIKVIKRIPLEIKPNIVDKQYLKTKKHKMSHQLKFV